MVGKIGSRSTTAEFHVDAEIVGTAHADAPDRVADLEMDGFDSA
jgi:hypothetical protein